MKRRYTYIGALIGLMLCLASMVQAKTTRIGMVYDGASPQCEKIKTLLFNEIQSLIQGGHTVSFPVRAQISGHWNLKKINGALDRLMASPEVDMVLVLGEVASHEACRRSSFPKPVFAVHMADSQSQDLASPKGTSGTANLNYINTLFDIDRDLRSFQRIASFSRVTFVVDEFIYHSTPRLETLTRRLARDFSMEVTVITAKTSAQDLLSRIPHETEAVFLASVPRLSDKELNKLAQGLIARSLPSFALMGRPCVEQGILAQATSQDHLVHVARHLAAGVREVLDGADPGTLPTLFAPGGKLTINMATARAIHVYPDWDLLIKAELINEAATAMESNAPMRRLNIRTAVQEALSANLDLAAAHRSVDAGAARVSQARSSLLPQITLNTRVGVVDDDRAQAYAGTLPEREWTGGIQVSQLIYSDKAWAGFEIEKHLQVSREQGRDAVRLNILQSSASAYLNVLRAKTIEKIQAENLKLTRKNLERARVRVEIGAGGPEEVFRWESQIAHSRRNVLSAQSVTLDAVTAMNDILNRPLSEVFSQEEIDFSDPLGILPDQRLMKFMNNAMALDLLKKFLVVEGRRDSPELKELTAALAAQGRTLTRSKRAFWSPTISLYGDLSESFAKEGEGSDYPSYRDDTDWSAGVEVSLPLYSGGKKSADLKQAREELSQLEYEYKSTANRIEKQVLNAVHLLRASYPGIRLSRDAADAAGRNLELVTDAYVRGIKSIIDLIDAQNQYLVADQQAANAVYDFLIDIMTMQRSIGNFVLFATPEKLDGWMERLQQFMTNMGYPGSGPEKEQNG